MSLKTSVRTIYGSLVQNALRWNTPLDILPNSTLNQKFGFAVNQLPNNNEKVHTRYIAVGLSGVELELDRGLYKANFRNYSPTQASLYKHIPWICRRLTEPLTPTERAIYRGRVIENHNGVDYEMWYLRLIDNLNVPCIAEQRRTENGKITPSSWEPTLEDLNPSPLQVITDERILNGKTYIAASKKMTQKLTPGEIQELINVATIVHGDPGFAEISELAVVSGVDRSVTGTFAGSTQNYIEAAVAQVNDFLRVRFSAMDNLGGKDLNLDAGSSEPMLLMSN